MILYLCETLPLGNSFLGVTLQSCMAGFPHCIESQLKTSSEIVLKRPHTSHLSKELLQLTMRVNWLLHDYIGLYAPFLRI